MNRLDMSVTSIGLLGSVMFPTVDVFRNLVFANSVAGFWYMHSEYEALHSQGSKWLGVVYRVPNRTMNNVCNLFIHAILPYFILRRQSGRRRASIACSIGLYVIGLILLDFDSVYPTRDGLAPYMHLHLVLFAVSHFL